MRCRCGIGRSTGPAEGPTVAHGTERGDELRGEHREMTRHAVPDCSTTSGRPGSPVSVLIVASVGNTARRKS